MGEFDLNSIRELNPNAVILDGLDDCIIGIAERFGFEPVLAYSVEKIIQLLMDRDGMDREEAQEFYEFNIFNLGVEHSPVFIE